MGNPERLESGGEGESAFIPLASAGSRWAVDIEELKVRWRELCAKRNSLEERLADGMPLLKGSLVRQFKVCGKKNCHCQNGKRHGPFTYLSMHIGGRTKMFFVREPDRPMVEELVGNYRVFRQLKAELVRLNREIAVLLEGMEALRLAGSETVLVRGSRPQRVS